MTCGKDKPLNEFDLNYEEEGWAQRFDDTNIKLPPNVLDWLTHHIGEKIINMIRTEEIKKGYKIQYRHIGILDYVLKVIKCGAGYNMTKEAYNI